LTDALEKHSPWNGSHSYKLLGIRLDSWGEGPHCRDRGYAILLRNVPDVRETSIPKIMTESYQVDILEHASIPC
jgi:hypothetical protein